MENEQKSWFHCGKCGALFLSRPGLWAGRRCSVCHAVPAMEALGESSAQAPLLEMVPAVRQAVAVRQDPNSQRERRMMVTIVLVWLLALGGIVVWGWNNLFEESPERSENASNDPGASKQEQIDRQLLQTELPKLHQTLMAFIASPTPEGKAQFVDEPTALVGKMTQFYAMNPGISSEIETLKLEGSTVLHLAEGEVIVTRWVSTDDRPIEAVFRKVGDEWRLDWQHFERYSDFPWAVFLAGEGDAEGEFRLLARERVLHGEMDDSRLSVGFYAPQARASQALVGQSPAFFVERKSSSGQLLEKAFAMEKSGKSLFQSPLPRTEMEGLIPVRVKIHRSGAGAERKFTLEQVLAAHWMNVKATGVEGE